MTRERVRIYWSTDHEMLPDAPDQIENQIEYLGQVVALEELDLISRTGAKMEDWEIL